MVLGIFLSIDADEEAGPYINHQKYIFKISSRGLKVLPLLYKSFIVEVTSDEI